MLEAGVNESPPPLPVKPLIYRVAKQLNVQINACVLAAILNKLLFSECDRAWLFGSCRESEESETIEIGLEMIIPMESNETLPPKAPTGTVWLGWCRGHTSSPVLIPSWKDTLFHQTLMTHAAELNHPFYPLLWLSRSEYAASRLQLHYVLLQRESDDWHHLSLKVHSSVSQSVTALELTNTETERHASIPSVDPLDQDVGIAALERVEKILPGNLVKTLQKETEQETLRHERLLEASLQTLSVALEQLYAEEEKLYHHQRQLGMFDEKLPSRDADDTFGHASTGRLDQGWVEEQGFVSPVVMDLMNAPAEENSSRAWPSLIEAMTFAHGRK